MDEHIAVQEGARGYTATLSIGPSAVSYTRPTAERAIKALKSNPLVRRWYAQQQDLH